ncbi:MAG: S8 family serine peptidase [Ilumatobacteraceae bacterium]
MAEPLGVHQHPSAHGRGRVWRHRPKAVIGGIAAIAAVSLIAPGSAAPRTADATTRGDPADSTVTLSMAVQPGAAVPMALIREAAASQLEGQGYTGQGIDVALIDSGVARVRGLDQAGKVLYGPDLSNEGAIPNLANLDTYGHGTHLAGIIAGNDGDQVLGIAPSSRIVSLKVAGATGQTDVAQVIAAIDWVVENRDRDGLNIRVLNLSMGVPGVPSNVGDPLSAAVERAWNAGIVVVAAAGNRGNAAGGVDSPAVDPYVIAVGAIERYDSWGNADSIAPWSSGGNAVRQADVSAPGRSVMSYRVPGSMLDSMFPAARVGDRYFKGSGTSQAAAVVSAYTAALLSRAPSLTPDQVKYLFRREARDMDWAGFLDGAGKIDAGDSAKRSHLGWKAPAQRFVTATGQAGLSGNLAASGASWSAGTWSGASWSGGTWSGASWSGASWSGASWSGASWSGGVWSGASWSGASWAGASWSGASWSGASWSGASWSGASWSGALWAGEVWQ